MKKILLAISILIILGSCNSGEKKHKQEEDTLLSQSDSLEMEKPIDISEVQLEHFTVETDIIVKDYHKWIAETIAGLNENRNYEIDEYILVHANSWIIDSLRNTDYYYLKELGIISKDPTAVTLITAGRQLIVPDSATTTKIKLDLKNTYLDLNIPEFTLRIKQYDSTLFEFPVRVGKNDRRYLAMAKRNINLRTMPGTGTIVRINRNPAFINPRDNKRYKVTRRDDNVVTALPNIPWIEPEINGIRYGHLIHPTTNIETLGKPVSNGCIGLRESDAWTVFFYAPMGTKVVIRYDLEIKDADGNKIKLKNIYPGFEKYQTVKKELEAAAKENKGLNGDKCYCGIYEEG
jgi:hypothetical protein